MPTDLSSKSDAELEALVANHRARNAMNRLLYAEALAEIARRKGLGLDFEKSLRIITAAARVGRFVGYKQLAEESGSDWAKVHWSIGPHLDQMLEYCFRRGWPLLPAIVVRQDELATGKLRDSSLEGFVKGCQRLGIEIVGSPEAFAEAEQRRVFEWAQSGAAL